MSRKVGSKNKVKEIDGLEIEKPVEKKIKAPTFLNCYHCNVKLGDQIVKKGSSNQYRFCGVECFNADDLAHDAE